MLNTEILKNLVNIDSPSGFTQDACKFIYDYLQDTGLRPTFTQKGAVRCNLGEKPKLVLAAHVDTLGGVVSKIKADGTLKMSNVGGLLLPSFEGSYAKVYTLGGKNYSATLLFDNPAAHVNRKAATEERNINNMHLRVDELVENADDVKKLGIDVGDFVCFDPGYQETESGFIKSKFMDNKASCFILMKLAEIYKNKPVPVQLFFSNYEEVGHGGAGGYEASVEEMLCLDMSVVGDEQQGKETKVSICAKDSSGPYDYEMRKKLVQLAQANNIDFVQDVYPFYGSDGSAALAAGNDFRVALIGMGVSASHGIERTHKKGIEATIRLCEAYIENKFGK